MAKCGITLRYPVKIVTVQEDGTTQETGVIGDAETLGQAVAMAEQRGFQVREQNDGGRSRFVPASRDGNAHFLVTTYAD